MGNFKAFSVVARPGKSGKRRLRPLCAWLILLTATALAQQIRDPFGAAGSNTSTTPTYQTQGATLLLTVNGGNKRPLDRQSVVKIRNLSTGDTLWQTTNDRSEASFGDLSVAQYDLEISAVGYLTSHQPFKVQSIYGANRLEIVLERDPSSVEIGARHAEQLPKKVRKALLRGVAALKSGNYKEAQKELDAARKEAPDNADLNFLSGYLAFQQKRLDEAKSFLQTAFSLDPGNTQALILLGRIELQQDDYETAQTLAEKASAADPQDWMAHDLLAQSYLKQREFEKAREQAQAAIERNKLASGSAQLVLGEALANLGRNEEAIAALKTFLEQTPNSPIAPQVRNLMAEISHPPAKDSETSAKSRATVIGPDPGLAAAGSKFSGMSGEPPRIDDSKPAVAAGVSCPTDRVVEMTGQRVKELADDVSRFAAIESLLHERLDATGFPATRETRTFNYVVAIAESPPGFLEVSEYRSERSGLADLPDHIASNGFISLALVFHPSMRDNFQLTCEGLGDWHGQATWLVHFQQRSDRPNRFHSYIVNGSVYPVALKGRAWIKADSFQIVRMESELVSPAPEIRLQTEHQIVDYGPVSFKKKNEDLWLPHSAELYFNLRNRRYHRRHSFDHFMLFAVDSAEKRSEPKEAKEPAQSPTPAPTPNSN
jgi:tetratricopeptide (TPR) repeat protein